MIGTNVGPGYGKVRTLSVTRLFHGALQALVTKHRSPSSTASSPLAALASYFGERSSRNPADQTQKVIVNVDKLLLV